MALWLAAAVTLVHLQHEGVLIRPGRDNAHERTSSLVKAPVQVPAWNVSEAVWEETVACLRRVYAPFAIAFTSEDPGDVPHLTGVFGGSPGTFGFPANVAGMSPFRADCSVIEESVVFVLTDVLPHDATTACRVMAQEIGHSFGLDHTLAEGDPMSIHGIDTEPVFSDEEVACGEYSPRPCGLPGRTCRPRQNSYALLEERLGSSAAIDSLVPADAEPEVMGGCASTRPTSLGGALALLALRRRRRQVTMARS